MANRNLVFIMSDQQRAYSYGPGRHACADWVRARWADRAEPCDRIRPARTPRRSIHLAANIEAHLSVNFRLFKSLSTPRGHDPRSCVRHGSHTLKYDRVGVGGSY